MGQTIACANQKGGVGKTTTVVNLGSYLALCGRARPRSSTWTPRATPRAAWVSIATRSSGSIYDAVIDGARLSDLTVPGPVEGWTSCHPRSPWREPRSSWHRSKDANIDWLGSCPTSRPNTTTSSIDCPPSLGLLTVNALTAADSVLIPLQCEYYALEGLTQLLATLDLIRDHLNPDLAIKGVVLTMFDAPDEAVRRRRRRGSSPPRGPRLPDRHPAQRPAVRGPEPRQADLELFARFDGCGCLCRACRGAAGHATGGSRPPVPTRSRRWRWRRDSPTGTNPGPGSRSRIAHPAAQPRRRAAPSRWPIERDQRRTRTSHASGSTPTAWRP